MLLEGNKSKLSTHLGAEEQWSGQREVQKLRGQGKVHFENKLAKTSDTEGSWQEDRLGELGVERQIILSLVFSGSTNFKLNHSKKTIEGLSRS